MIHSSRVRIKMFSVFVLSPSLPLIFPALSLALFFARAPLSERLEQARVNRETS